MPKPNHARFTIDHANSGDQYLYITVGGLGTVAIKAQDDGIVVDIYPLHASNEAIASTWAHINDLTNDAVK